MIPPKVILEGDKIKAEKLRGFALSQLEILKNTMKFQNLKQDVRMLQLAGGSWIKAVSNFGLNVVTIFAPPVLIPEREAVELEGVVEGGFFVVVKSVAYGEAVWKYELWELIKEEQVILYNVAGGIIRQPCDEETFMAATNLPAGDWLDLEYEEAWTAFTQASVSMDCDTCKSVTSTIILARHEEEEGWCDEMPKGETDEEEQTISSHSSEYYDMVPGLEKTIMGHSTAYVTVSCEQEYECKFLRSVWWPFTESDRDVCSWQSIAFDCFFMSSHGTLDQLKNYCIISLPNGTSVETYYEFHSSGRPGSYTTTGKYHQLFGTWVSTGNISPAIFGRMPPRALRTDRGRVVIMEFDSVLNIYNFWWQTKPQKANGRIDEIIALLRAGGLTTLEKKALNTELELIGYDYSWTGFNRIDPTVIPKRLKTSMAIEIFLVQKDL